MVTVKLSRRSSFTLPRAYRSYAKKGEEFMVSMSGDTLMFRKIRKPIWDVARENPDKNPPSLEEICEIVRKVRKKMGKEK